MGDSLTLIGILVTAIGSTASVVGIALVLIQLRSSQRIARGEFLLHLTDQLNEHKAIYQALQDATWRPAPDDRSTMTELESYWSVFEQDEVLINYGIIELEVFIRLHGHRIMFIILNDFSYQMLSAHPEYWSDFIHLCHSMGKVKNQSDGNGTVPDSWKTSFERIEKFRI